MNNAMKLQYTRPAWDKMMTYVTLCPNEISGLGKIEIQDGVMTVVDVAIFKQTVSAAHAHINSVELANFMAGLIKKKQSPKGWYCWWHSHAEMSAFFSGTDTGTMASSTEFPHLVSVVVNHKAEWKARLDIRTPVDFHIDMDIEILEVPNDSFKAICQKEINEKVSMPKHEAPKTSGMGFRTPSTSHGRGLVMHDDPYDLPAWRKNGLGTKWPSSTTPTIEEVDYDREMEIWYDGQEAYYKKKQQLFAEIAMLKKKKKLKSKHRKHLLKLEEWYAEHLQFGLDSRFEVPRSMGAATDDEGEWRPAGQPKLLEEKTERETK